MANKQTSIISACKRCGNCCKRGGPSLHPEDKILIENGIINIENIITHRKGETVFNPFTKEECILEKEFIRIRGKNYSWMCFFYVENNKLCDIHMNKPLQCKVHKCWDQSEYMNIVNQEKLNRFSILINGNNPFIDIIKNHEKQCSWLEINSILDGFNYSQNNNGGIDTLVTMIKEIIERDLEIRSSIKKSFGLTIGEELFLLGRPISLILKNHSKISKGVLKLLQHDGMAST